MKTLNPFHLAIPVDNLEICKDFYENTLECSPGRSSKIWADYSFFGHQLVLHFDPNKKKYIIMKLMENQFLFLILE